jgi:hypothetical protein
MDVGVSQSHVPVDPRSQVRQASLTEFPCVQLAAQLCDDAPDEPPCREQWLRSHVGEA